MVDPAVVGSLPALHFIAPITEKWLGLTGSSTFHNKLRESEIVDLTMRLRIPFEESERFVAHDSNRPLQTSRNTVTRRDDSHPFRNVRETSLTLGQPSILALTTGSNNAAPHKCRRKQTK